MHFYPTNQSKLLNEIATFFQSKPTNNQLIVPSQFGEGLIYNYAFEGIDILLFDCTLKEKLHFTYNQKRQQLISILANTKHTVASIELNLSKSRRLRLLKNTLYHINNQSYTVNLAKNDSICHWLIQIDPLQIQAHLPNTNEKADFWRNTRHFQSINSNIGQEMYELIAKTSNTKQALEKLYVNTQILSLLWQLLLQVKQQQARQSLIMASTPRQKLYEIEQYLNKHLAQSTHTSIIAQYVGLSESKLKRLFKAHYGKSIYQYKQDLRMAKAKTLLDSGNYNISQVAYTVGYSNPSHFSDMFKRYFGQMPSKYLAANDQKGHTKPSE